MDAEKTMQFILEMRAKREVFLQKHEEAVQRHIEEIAEIRGLVAANTSRITQLVDVSMSPATAKRRTYAFVKQTGSSGNYGSRKPTQTAALTLS